MMEIMTREVQTNDLKEVVNKLIPDSIRKGIEKACQSIYPLHDVFVRKVKMLKKPKSELGKLMELHANHSWLDEKRLQLELPRCVFLHGYSPNPLQ
ncbi:40S ribosomal protein S3a [Sigmodon hispidus]